MHIKPNRNTKQNSLDPSNIAHTHTKTGRLLVSVECVLHFRGASRRAFIERRGRSLQTNVRTCHTRQNSK